MRRDARAGSATARRAASPRSPARPRRTDPAQTAGSSAIAQAQATHEYPSPPPPPQTATGAAPTAARAVRAFATAYINWNAQTVSADMRALAARSVGQARAAMTLAAAETAGDYELQRGGIANSGTVEAVAPLPGTPASTSWSRASRRPPRNTTAYQGLQPAWHVALATCQRCPVARWALSGWQPEN